MTVKKIIRPASEEVVIEVLSYDITPNKLLNQLNHPSLGRTDSIINFQHGKSQFVSEILESNREFHAYHTDYVVKGCCLGVACVMDGADMKKLKEATQAVFSIVEVDVDNERSVSGRIYIPIDHWLNTEVGNDEGYLTVQDLLMSVNDSYIGEGYGPVCRVLDWLCAAGILDADSGHRKPRLSPAAV